MSALNDARIVSFRIYTRWEVYKYLELLRFYMTNLQSQYWKTKKSKKSHLLNHAKSIHHQIKTNFQNLNIQNPLKNQRANGKHFEFPPVELLMLAVFKIIRKWMKHISVFYLLLFKASQNKSINIKNNLTKFKNKNSI